MEFCSTLKTASLSGVWAPETSWSFHCWQPAPKGRLYRWLAKPENPAMSSHAPAPATLLNPEKKRGVGGERVKRRTVKHHRKFSFFLPH